jgi:hypothetical protein
MNAIDIIKAYLEEHKIDGMYNEDYICGCSACEFPACKEENIGKCEPAYIHTRDLDSWQCQGCSGEGCDNIDGEHCFRPIRELEAAREGKEE